MDTNSVLSSNESKFWKIVTLSTCLKLALIPAYHSTDFEVHRNWLAITFTLPVRSWYYDKTSEWTLDYPPLFAYFEWLLAQIAQYFDPQMLLLSNHNYASNETKHFQRISVIVMDVIYIWGVWRMLRVFKKLGIQYQSITAEGLLLMNVGLIFVDHIHFQYNGFLLGVLLLSISYMLEERFLMGCLMFAVLLNLKHIFLYVAPAFAVYLLRFYCFEGERSVFTMLMKLLCVGLTPFVISFGPFYRDLPQVFKRLFPFKRGLTHAYWAPNFWALYNTGDKVASAILKVPLTTSYTSGLVQEFQHVVLPSIKPLITFILTLMAMMPILIKLGCYADRSQSKMLFLRSVVLCSLSSYMFGWHVHEKAILISLIPLCFLFFIHQQDAKYAFLLSAVGYASLFPLLFEPELWIIRYALYLAYVTFMGSQFVRYFKMQPAMNVMEDFYIYGLVLLPLYEHVISPLTGLSSRLPFMILMLTSFYCSVGILYVFIRYYIYALDIKFKTKTKAKIKTKLSENVRNIKKLKKEKNK